MITAKMKRITLIIARSDFEIVLRGLMQLGCVEITSPDELLIDPELRTIVKREVYMLDKFHANLDSIVLLATQHTLLLTGWISARSEPELAAHLSKFICAWETEAPDPDESQNVPVKLMLPKLFKVFHKGGGNLFNPLIGGVRNSDFEIEE